MTSALMTGITGQDELYLSELLLAKGYNDFGLIRGQNYPKEPLVRQTVPGLQLVSGDQHDTSSLSRTLQWSASELVRPIETRAQLVEGLVRNDLALLSPGPPNVADAR